MRSGKTGGCRTSIPVIDIHSRTWFFITIDPYKGGRFSLWNKDTVIFSPILRTVDVFLPFSLTTLVHPKGNPVLSDTRGWREVGLVVTLSEVTVLG